MDLRDFLQERCCDPCGEILCHVRCYSVWFLLDVRVSSPSGLWCHYKRFVCISMGWGEDPCTASIPKLPNSCSEFVFSLKVIWEATFAGYTNALLQHRQKVRNHILDLFGYRAPSSCFTKHLKTSTFMFHLESILIHSGISQLALISILSILWSKIGEH